MAKVVFNYKKLSTEVIPNLRNIIKKMENMKNLIEKMNIPDDFEYKNYYQLLYGNINNWIQRYLNLIEAIENNNVKLSSNIVDIDFMIDSIKTF